MIVQDVLRVKTAVAGKWDLDRVWVASSAFAYFTYEWWSHRKNGDDPRFLRALNGCLYAMADEVSARMGCAREDVVGAVRQAYPEFRDAFLKLDASQPHSAGVFGMDLQAVLHGIALTDQSLVARAFDPHAQVLLGTLMIETMGALDWSRSG